MTFNTTGLAKRPHHHRFPERLSALREPVYLPTHPLTWMPVLAAIAGIVAIVWCWSTLSGTLRTRPSPATGPSSTGVQPPARTALQGGLAPAFTPQVLRWSGDIERWAGSAGLGANLVATVMQIESCGDPNAVSGSGAIGLFQVMPYHFQTGDNPFDPDTNARVGLAYLAAALHRAHGDPQLALAAYNGGQRLIDLPLSSWPDETQRYIAWGTGLLGDITDGRLPSPTLENWLTAGGSALCRRAGSSTFR